MSDTAASEVSICLPSSTSIGFSAPIQEQAKRSLDLNEYLITHPSATFFVRVSGDSMVGEGIFPKDILIVNKALTATHGQIVIAEVSGELTVKKLYKKDGKIKLLSYSSEYEEICFEQDDNSTLDIWGVVTNSIRSF